MSGINLVMRRLSKNEGEPRLRGIDMDRVERFDAFDSTDLDLERLFERDLDRDRDRDLE